MTRPRAIGTLALALLLGALTAMGWGARAAYPWIAWPELRAEDWEALVAAAGSDPVCSGDATELSAALAAIEPEARAIDEDLDDGRIDQLPDAVVDALDRLSAWHRGGGGLGGGLPLSDAIPAFRLGRVAVATGEPELVEAAMALGRALRRCGPLLHGAIGFEIASVALEASPEQVARMPVELRPTDDDLLATLLGEAVSSDGMVTEAMARPDQVSDLPWWASVARERAMVRAYYVDRLREPPRDRRELAARFDDDALPASLTVRVVATGVGRVLGDLGEVLDRYEAAGL